MNDWPLIVVMLLTFERTDYAVRTIRHMNDNFNYPNWAWYLADSGSADDSFDIKKKAILDGGQMAAGHHNLMSPGGSWNQAVRSSLGHTDFVFRLEDDWALPESLDMRPYVELLSARTDICMVRFGYLHVPADLEAIAHNGIHYLRYKKSTRHAYGGHPALTNKRMYDAYGFFNEDLGPGDIELDYDRKFRENSGPDAVRPASIGGWGVFSHFGERQSYQ